MAKWDLRPGPRLIAGKFMDVFQLARPSAQRCRPACVLHVFSSNIWRVTAVGVHQGHLQIPESLRQNFRFRGGLYGSRRRASIFLRMAVQKRSLQSRRRILGIFHNGY